MTAVIQDMPEPVRCAFEAVPAPVGARWRQLRTLILETAARTPDAGALTETLKWGEPAYLTEATRSGTPVRLGWKAATPDTVKLLVHCQTSLVRQWRDLYGGAIRFEGNRAILAGLTGPLPAEALAHCIAMALTYKLKA